MRIIVFWVGLILLAGTAYAQTAPDTTVDFTPLIQSAIVAAAGIVTAIGAWLAFYVKGLISAKWDLSKTELDEKLQEMFNAALRRAIDYGTAKAQELLKDKATIDVKSVIVKQAADYFIQFWPDLLTKLGLTPDQIAKTIEARLPPTSAPEVKAAIEVSKTAEQVAKVAAAGDKP